MAAIIESILMAFLIITISVCQSIAAEDNHFHPNESAAQHKARHREHEEATVAGAIVFFLLVFGPCICCCCVIALIIMCINDMERANRSQVVYVQGQGQPMYVTQPATGNVGQGGAPVVIYKSVPATTATPVVVYTPAPVPTPTAVYRPAPAAQPPAGQTSAPAAKPKAGQTPTPVVSQTVTPTVTSVTTRAAPEVIGGSATDSTETRRSN